MRKWSKYALEVGGVPTYFSAANWRGGAKKTPSDKGDTVNKSLDERFKFYIDCVTSVVVPGLDILSLGSGYADAEIVLRKSGYAVTCTDTDKSIVEHVRKNLPEMPYVVYSPKDSAYEKTFSAVISFSVFYLFNPSELSVVFKNVRQSLKKDGLLIIDIGGGPNNIVTWILDSLQKIEIFFRYVFLTLLGKKVKLIKKSNGYRSTDKEVVRIAQSEGLQLLEIRHLDTSTELTKRTWVGRSLAKIGFIKRVMMYCGTYVPYVRIMIFKA